MIVVDKEESIEKEKTISSKGSGRHEGMGLLFIRNVKFHNMKNDVEEGVSHIWDDIYDS
jgi:hypothetical protein